MIISIIVAMDSKGVIGKHGTLPWQLSSDLQHFKKITMGKPIVMGRKTHESIRRILPGRENVVVSRDKTYMVKDCTVLHSLECAYAKYHDSEEIMIMGGAELYAQTLEKANRIYLTEVHADCEGDTFFPLFDQRDFKEIDRQDFKADKKNEYDYSFVVLERNDS